METKTYSFHLHHLYDRLMHDVYAEIDVAYDIDSINTNGVQDGNLYVENIRFAESSQEYLKSNPFDLDRIENEILSYFADPTNLVEFFLEMTDDETYEKVKDAILE